MRWLARGVMVLYTLILTVLAILLVAGAAGWDIFFYWERLRPAPGQTWLVGVVGAVVALVGVWSLLAGVGRGAPLPPLVNSTALGDVHISLPALEALITRAAREVSGVREARPHLRPVGDGVAVFLEVVLAPQSPMPAATAEIQERVGRQLEELAGVRAQEIRVLVQGVGPQRAARVR